MRLSSITFIAVLPLVVTGDRAPQRTLRGAMNQTSAVGERSGSSSNDTRALDVGTCGGGAIGNGVCPDTTTCCSIWGWCGTGSDYCDNGFDPAPVAPPVAAPAPVTGSSDSEQWLAAHNSRRTALYAQYNLSPKDLKWSDSLAASAQAYSESLLSLSDCQIQHGFQGDRYGGENLAANWGNSQSRTPDEVLTSWFEDEQSALGGHFTQVAWRASSYVGCGAASKALSDSSTCFIQTCRYLAPGNCIVDSSDVLSQALAESSPCGPDCPSEGCF